MADESSIYAVVSGDSAVVALIGSRFYDQMVPPNLAQPVTTPYVIATVVSDVPNNVLNSAPGISEFRIQFDVYATAAAQGKAKCKAVLNAIRAALATRGFENFSQDMPADDSTLRRIMSDWSFQIAR